MTRREFPRRIRAEIVLRSLNVRGHVCCEGCGLVLGKKAYEIDHTIPEGLVIDKSRPLIAKDGKLLGKACCHRGEDGKTAKDVAMIAKAVRQSNRHLGIRRSSSPMPGGRGSKWKKTFSNGWVLR